MLFGAHVSIAGGLPNAPKNAAALGCEALQMFTRSPQGGPAPKITPEIMREFQTERERAGIKQVAVHAPYYINLASAELRIRTNSIRIIREDLERASLIGAEYLMFHPGSSKDLGPKAAMDEVVKGMKEVLKDYRGSCQCLIEISAGTGEIIGDTFEEIAEILERAKADNAGVCFDTQHAFASGYDLRDGVAVKKTFDEFDRVIGLERLKMSHCNDSKVELGAKRDRHEHLGKGSIGLEGFHALVHEPRLQNVNFFLETEPDGVRDDLEILKKIRDERKS